MTNSTTTTMQSVGEISGPPNRRTSDAAPMVITRLSGWIDVNEAKAEFRGWIIPTTVHQSAR